MTQTPDTAPGPYYVSVIRPEKPSDPRLLAGPSATHAEALANVDEATRLAQSLDPRAAFYAFGTVRTKPECNKLGILNELGRMRQ